jgi:ABC-type branched-subunit amino acid transport system substrate-binding protein
VRLGGVTAAVACVVALPSCGGLGDLIGAGAQAGGPRIATVVVLVPDSGEHAADGVGVAAAVQTALTVAAPSGWEVEVERVADGAARSAAAEVAAEIADDDDVIAVIGGLSAEVVRAVQPILDRNGIPFISPADGSPEHTRGPDPSAPLRPYETYFRTAVVGEEPEGLAARYAADGLGVEAMVVVQHERVAEARRFTDQARSLGVQVAAAEPGDIASGLSIARESDAGAVYVAGAAEFAAAVTTEVVRSGLDAWVIGGADLHDDDFLTAAGSTSSRSVAIVPATLDTTINRAVPGLADAGRFGAAAYDAGSAVAVALDHCLPPVREGRASAARTGCVAELGAVSLEGVTGELAFDRFGDRHGAWPSAYVVVNGEWQEVGGAMTR